MAFESFIKSMELSIIENLKGLDVGYGRQKKFISNMTGIPIDILTVILKRLKNDGKVEIIMIWSEEGVPNGSGYCLTNDFRNETN